MTPPVRCSEDPDVKGTETNAMLTIGEYATRCSEDPDVKGTETICFSLHMPVIEVAARIPM